LDKSKHPDTYQQLDEIFQQYASVKMMRYCNQTNEALNQAIANIAPKSVCYSGSISLYSRIALVIGTHNEGYKNYYTQLFFELGITMTSLLSNYLERRDGKKERKRKFQQRFDVKVRWSKQQNKQREEIYKECTDISYGPGVAVITELGTESRKRKKGSADSGNKTKCRCGSTQHS
jgi:hypothetical protein